MTAEPRPVEEIRTDIARAADLIADGDDARDVLHMLAMDVAPLLTRLAAADRENADLRRDVASLTEQIAATDVRVVELVGQVAEADRECYERSLEQQDAEARLEAVRAIRGCLGAGPMDYEQFVDEVDEILAGTSQRIAALSAAPQPEPPHGFVEDINDYSMCVCGRAALGHPEPLASDEPARCVHGWNRPHMEWSGPGCVTCVECPGPAASGTPDGGQR